MTDALSTNKYFVNVTDPTEDNIDVVTKYTLAQEQVLDDYLGNNATYEGIRAFSTTINADADPVDVLDTGEDIFFSLTGEHSNHFTIDNSTGEIFWKNPDVVADYEEVSNAVYNVIVTATDVSAGGVLGASSNPQPIMMHLTDVNETPTIEISGATNGIINVSEDSDVATSLATITTDDDDGDAVTLSVDNADFSVQETGAGTGTFQLFANSLDHETDDQMVVNITASDGVKSLSKQLTVNVDDVNETPEFGLPVGGIKG